MHCRGKTTHVFHQPVSQNTQIFKKTRGYWKGWIYRVFFLLVQKSHFCVLGLKLNRFPPIVDRDKDWVNKFSLNPNTYWNLLIGTSKKNTLYDCLWYWKKSVLIAPWQAAGPVTNWYIFAFSDEDSTSLCSAKTASGPNRVHPLSSGKSFAQNEKKAHSELEAQRAWQASAEISIERGAPRTSSIGWYFTFSLIQPGSLIVRIISGLFAFFANLGHRTEALANKAPIFYQDQWCNT